jgi:hypothetical protein
MRAGKPNLADKNCWRDDCEEQRNADYARWLKDSSKPKNYAESFNAAWNCGFSFAVLIMLESVHADNDALAHEQMRKYGRPDTPTPEAASEE